MLFVPAISPACFLVSTIKIMAFLYFLKSSLTSFLIKKPSFGFFKKDLHDFWNLINVSSLNPDKAFLSLYVGSIKIIGLCFFALFNSLKI